MVSHTLIELLASHEMVVVDNKIVVKKNIKRLKRLLVNLLHYDIDISDKSYWKYS